MSYADDEKSETIVGASAKLLRALRMNPSLFMLLFAVYLTGFAAFYLYQHARRQVLESEERVARLRGEVSELSAERQFFVERSKAPNVDIFKRLSFNEKSTPQDTEKLQAALSLNSYARYALHNQDLQKARETLDQSLRTFPTLEARYYSGVVDYLAGNNEGALGSWARLAKSTGAPDDIYIYLSLAEYRSGNTEAAKKYAEMYSRLH